MKFNVALINPPYNPSEGTKRGGGLYLEFIKKVLSLGADHTAMVVPFTWQVRKDCQDVRDLLVQGGLKYIKQLPPKTFKVNILTQYFICEKGYKGPITQDVYRVDDVNKYETTLVSSTSDIIPVVRSDSEKVLFDKIWKFKNHKVSIYSGEDNVTNVPGVEYPYLIGMECEKMNIVRPMRIVKVKKAGEKISNPKHRFIQTSSLASAKRLAKFLDSEGQEFLRCIPRGSSLENWMVSPLIGYYYDNSK